jgi:hypothetical protein
MDDTRYDGEDARWVSYAQLAQARGISKDSAIRLVRRERWRKMPGNDADKTVRVLVPAAWLLPAARADALPSDREDAPPDVTRIAAAEARADTAIALAERTLTQLAEANARADRAETRADNLQRDLNAVREAAREAIREAQNAAEALRQADAKRKARGLVARLRSAWRGE